jgi:hypothetical protein
VGTPIEFKRLARVELSSVAETDRTERIDLIYEQRGTELEERRGNWSSAAWDPAGTASSPSRRSGTPSSITSTRVGSHSAPSREDG